MSNRFGSIDRYRTAISVIEASYRNDVDACEAALSTLSPEELMDHLEQMSLLVFQAFQADPKHGFEEFIASARRSADITEQQLGL
jgi:hypothetical protein